MNCTGVLGDERNMPQVRRLGGGFSAWRAPHSIQLGTLHVWAAYKWSNGVKDRLLDAPVGQRGSSSVKSRGVGGGEGRKTFTQPKGGLFLSTSTVHAAATMLV